MNPFIEARNIALVFKSKDRDPVTALNNFNIEVGKGEFVSIVGPSGCGKSTFLNMLLGLIKPGSVRINGTPITGPDQERAMVFQEFGLLPCQSGTRLYAEILTQASTARLHWTNCATTAPAVRQRCNGDPADVIEERCS
jgi:NitT/TauT family transport system ATP-binding protein